MSSQVALTFYYAVIFLILQIQIRVLTHGSDILKMYTILNISHTLLSSVPHLCSSVMDFQLTYTYHTSKRVFVSNLVEEYDCNLRLLIRSYNSFYVTC